MNYRNRSARCKHGMARDLVACPACGDAHTWLERLEQRQAANLVLRRQRRREQVISRPHGRPSNQAGTR